MEDVGGVGRLVVLYGTNLVLSKVDRELCDAERGSGRATIQYWRRCLWSRDVNAFA
jgi:hypothetical protein